MAAGPRMYRLWHGNWLDLLARSLDAYSWTWDGCALRGHWRAGNGRVACSVASGGAWLVTGLCAGWRGSMVCAEWLRHRLFGLAGSARPRLRMCMLNLATPWQWSLTAGPVMSGSNPPSSICQEGRATTASIAAGSYLCGGDCQGGWRLARRSMFRRRRCSTTCFRLSRL